MPLSNEEELIICTTDDCDQAGEYRNDYLRGMYCLNCHEGIMGNYYEDDDKQRCHHIDAYRNVMD